MSVLRSLGLRAPLHPAFPRQGELDSPNPILNPSCDIAQLWLVSFCWRLKLPKQVPRLHSQRGLGNGACRTGHLRAPLCARPLAGHQDTVSERGPCSPGAHSRTRETRLSWPSQLGQSCVCHSGRGENGPLCLRVLGLLGPGILLEKDVTPLCSGKRLQVPRLPFRPNPQ